MNVLFALSSYGESGNTSKLVKTSPRSGIGLDEVRGKAGSL